MKFSKFHLELNHKKQQYFIKDAVHREINFDQHQLWLYELVNTPEMQRLTKIMQLSLSYNNFPTATHTRLSHCLGVYEVCNKFIKELLYNKSLILNPQTQIQINVALAAGLLHDIGHGPHSHAFEKYLHFNHEQVGEAIITSPETKIHQILVQKANKDGLAENYYVNHVAAIINKKNKDPDLIWVQDLISSQIDADRLDYLVRDSYFSGLNYGQIDINLIAKWSVIYKNQMVGGQIVDAPKLEHENKLVFLDKAQFLISAFLNGRLAMYMELYENYYSHCYEALIGLMLKKFTAIYTTPHSDPQLTKYADFYALLEPYMQLQPKFNIAKFLKLTDETFNLIVRSFCDFDDPTLKSLANLFQGYVDASNHIFLRFEEKSIKMLEQKILNEHPLEELNCFNFYVIKRNAITFYDATNAILIYDSDQNQVFEYETFLAKKPLIHQHCERIKPHTSKCVIIIAKHLIHNKTEKEVYQWITTNKS